MSKSHSLNLQRLSIQFSIAVIVAGLSDTMPQAVASAADPEIQAILEQLRLSVDRVKSIEYKYELTQVQNGEEIDHQIVTRVSEGNSFYVSVNSPKAGKTTERAYDGQEHQSFSDSDKILKLRKLANPQAQGREYLGIEPIVIPFTFVFRDSDPLTFPALLDKTRWNELAAKASLSGKAQVEGRQCRRLRIDLTMPKRTLMVYLCQELGNYPIKIADGENDERLETIITPATFATEHGDVIIPSKITENYWRDGQIRRVDTYSIDVSTVRINQPVDPKWFTLDKSDVAIGTYNGETKEFIPSLEGATGEYAVRSDAPWRKFTLLAAVPAAALFALIVVLIRRRKGRTQNT